MSRPNLLFLMTDQQRADTIEAQTICQTPNLDRLVAGGTRFNRCYTVNPICSPVRASLLTGLLPHNHGMVDVISLHPFQFFIQKKAGVSNRTFPSFLQHEFPILVDPKNLLLFHERRYLFRVRKQMRVSIDAKFAIHVCQRVEFSVLYNDYSTSYFSRHGLASIIDSQKFQSGFVNEN